MKKMCTVMVFCLLGIFGCSGGGGSGSGPVKSPTDKTLVSIKVTPADNVLAVGLQKQFTATGIYSDNQESDLTSLVDWSSSNPTVAAVSNGPDSKGMVTILDRSAQSIVITARLNSVSGKASLGVPPTELVTIAISPVNTTMAVGTSYNFKATGTYSDGTSSDITSAVQWSSSVPSVATAAGSGKVTAAAAGTTTLAATLGPKTSSTTLKVTSAALNSISITPPNSTLAMGNTLQFVATGHFSDGSSQDLTSAVTWKSSAPLIAVISGEGNVTPVSAGTATISATFKSVPNDISVDTVLTVVNVELLKIDITPGTADLVAGSTKLLTATGTYSDGTIQDLSRSVKWSSSDPSVAVISDGTLQAAGALLPVSTLLAEKAGSATITATFAAVSASASTTVTPADISGTWNGTYTIYDDPKDPSQIGTYNFSLVITQNGNVITGTTMLRGSRSDVAVSNQLTGNIWGRRVDFQFTYFSPLYSMLMENLGKLELKDATMVGSAVENFDAGYNCSYVISVVKQP